MTEKSHSALVDFTSKNMTENFSKYFKINPKTRQASHLVRITSALQTPAPIDVMQGGEEIGRDHCSQQSVNRRVCLIHLNAAMTGQI